MLNARPDPEIFGRRELLERGGRYALAAGLLPAGFVLAQAGDRRIRELERALQGPVLARGEAGYARARLLFNTRFDAVKPLAVAFPETVADVEKAVNWAKRHGVRIAARSGGHSYGGYSTTSGLVVDLERLAGIRVQGGTARIGGGALLIDVYDRLARRGVTIPAGSCPTVGIGGLALGGGVGFTSRRFGLTCDSIQALTIVTAAGDALVCSESENADLYWACRGGGGGNFGIVTGFTFRAHPVGNVSTFSIQWPWSQARSALRAWQEWAPAAPDGIFSVCNLRATGDPGATPRITAVGQFLGPEAELRRLLQPLVDTGTPTRVAVRTRSYMSSVYLWAACGDSVAACRAAPRATYKAKSDYALRPLPPAAIGTILRRLEARQRNQLLGGGGLLLDSYGGAINRVAKDETAFVHRNALFSFQYLADWNAGDPPRVVAANLDWIRRFYAAMRPHVSGFAYQNYIDPDLAGWKRAYYGSNYARLVSVKRARDPGNLFRFRQSIPTRA